MTRAGRVLAIGLSLAALWTGGCSACGTLGKLGQSGKSAATASRPSRAVKDDFPSAREAGLDGPAGGTDSGQHD